MTKPVFILGGEQTDFSHHCARNGEDISDLTRTAILGALHSADLDVSAIQSIHVGNAFAELQRGQAHLGTMPATVIPELYGLPAMRHEAACASGSLAVLAAMSEIEAGRYDCVLVLGVEEERNTTGADAAKNMGSACWVGHEQLPGRFMWPAAFGQLTLEYERRHGLKRDCLARIAEQNFANARKNPNAQTRDWRFQPDSFSENDDANPQIEEGMRRNHCAQITDGGSAVILASENFARNHAAKRGQKLDQLPRILGWGHKSADLPLASKLARAEPGGLMFPHVQATVQDALRRAGLKQIDQTSGIELHDCFAMTEYMLIDHIGLTPPGEAWRVIENGDIVIGGRFPVNPSGGLMGGGHPVGATGVRMLWDAAKQVTDRAGDYQVEGASTFATLNIGGSFGTVCSFVVGTAA